MEYLKQSDHLGTSLLIAGLSLFMLGISWGGQPLPWNSPRILGLLITGFVCLFAFILYEIYGNVKYPIIPMPMFKDVRGFACINIISAITGCINVALFIVWPSQVVYIFGSTAKNWEMTAWLSTTVCFGSWTGIIIFGSIYHLLKRVRWQLLVGSLWMTAFGGAMSSIKRENLGAAVFISFGSMLTVGWGEVITMLLVQYLVEDGDLGVGFGNSLCCLLL
jgi:hypothetical protein